MGKIPEWSSLLPMEAIATRAKAFGVDSSLIAAIVMKESSGNRFASRYEPIFRYIWETETCAKRLKCSEDTEIIGQKTSYGLMQIMGSVAREWGFLGWFGELYEIETNLNFGIKHLRQYLLKYPNVSDAISSYNQGSPRRGSDGLYLNQKYVETVLLFKKQLEDGTNK